MPTSIPNILFLCTGNSCRSQMAEGFARHFKADRFNAWSAGIERHGLNPNAVAVMAEKGIDISNHTSKVLGELAHIDFNYVITVCGHAHETCPVFSGDCTVVHIGFEDPPQMALAFKGKEEKLDCYRKVRDEIEAFIMSLPEALPGFTEKSNDPTTN